MTPIAGHTVQMAMTASELKLTGLHKRLGHMSNQITAKTAKLYGWKMTGLAKDYKSCKLAKAQQKNMHLPRPNRKT